MHVLLAVALRNHYFRFVSGPCAPHVKASAGAGHKRPQEEVFFNTPLPSERMIITREWPLLPPARG